MLRHAPDVFGNPFGGVSMAGVSGEPIYDMSIGYDFAGIQTPKVVNFVRGLIDATKSVRRLRDEIPRWLAPLRELDYPTELSRSITLSTFHGCPAGEIERICEFLLTELDVNVIVKMNPPMLGRDRLEHLLYDVMGYTELRVNEKAYSAGLQFDESLEICNRLWTLAKSRGLHFGAKFSNTLEVENHRDVFSPAEKIMYLSGAPLHVITLTLAGEFRNAMGAKFPISFSAGVDRKNFSNLVACGIVPITTCTDLLKTGGYGRLPPYLHDLQTQMARVGVRTVDDFILDARGQRAAAGGDPVQAGFLNTPIIIAETQADPRYGAAHNRAVPKKINSHLVTFDCITCDKCIPVCPNDANFSYHTGEVSFTYRDVEVRPDGSAAEIGDEKVFALEKADQIANFADYCNHCGNCDTFCPEYDGPYLKKPNFYGSRRAFEAGAPHDGYLLERSNDSLTLVCRIQARTYTLEQFADGGERRYDDGMLAVRVAADGAFSLDRDLSPPHATHTLDVGRYHAINTLLRGITNSARVHPVNVPLLSAAEA
jgi:putative selenate reductase